MFGDRLLRPRGVSRHDHIEWPRLPNTRASTERRSPATRLIALVLCVSLVAAACSSSNGGDDSAATNREPSGVADEDRGLVGTGVFGGAFGDDSVDEAIDRLAESGIAVFPDEGGPAIVEPDEPASPLPLLRWQARNLTLEAASGGGLLGSDLDGLVAPDPDHPEAPSPAQFLAAYVHGVETPGAELSRELIGDQDLSEPDTVVFPTMVVTLFVSDLARAADELAGPEPDTEPEDTDTTELGAAVEIGPVQLASSSQAICPDFAGAINETISHVVKILKLPRITVPDTGIPILNSILQAGADLFVGFLNFAIDAAAEFLIDGIAILLKPVFSVVTSIAAVLAVTGQIVSALKPWSVQATAAEDPIHRGVGAPATDEITVRVSVPGPTEWPDFIQSCAHSLRLDLPPLRPHGGHVTWNTVDPRGVASVSSKEETLDDTSAARLVLDVGQETPEQHAKGQEDRALVKVTASLRRQEVEDFKALVRSLVNTLFDGVPAIIRQHLTYYSTHGVDFFLNDLADHIIAPKAFVYLTVTFHGPPEPDDENGPTTPGSSQPDSGQPGGGQPGGGQSRDPDITIPDRCLSADALGYSVEPAISIWESGAVHCQYAPFFYILIGHGETPPLHTRGVTLRCIQTDDCALEVVTSEGYVVIAGHTEQRVLEIARMLFHKEVAIDYRG